MNTNQVPQQILDHMTAVIKSAVKEAADEIIQQRPSCPIASDEESLSAEQAAKLLKIKLNTVYSKVEKGELPHYRSGKRKLLFLKQELDQYIASRRGKTNKDISAEAHDYILKK